MGLPRDDVRNTVTTRIIRILGLTQMAKQVASEAFDFPSTGQRERRSLTFWRITAAVLTFSTFLVWTWPWISPRISTRFVAGADSDVPDIGFPESFLRSW